MGMGSRSAKNLHKFIDNIPSLLGKYKCNNGFLERKVAEGDLLEIFTQRMRLKRQNVFLN